MEVVIYFMSSKGAFSEKSICELCSISHLREVQFPILFFRNILTLSASSPACTVGSTIVSTFLLVLKSLGISARTARMAGAALDSGSSRPSTIGTNISDTSAGIREVYQRKSSIENSSLELEKKRKCSCIQR